MAEENYGVKDEDLYREQLPNVCGAISGKAKNCCSYESVKRVLPVLDWLPKYRLKFLVADFVAGLTVGLTTIPQAIAYGTVAGLTPEYGLYSAFMGCFVYIVFGTCKDITVGPTAIMALMTKPHVSGSADYAILSCFLSGCLILLLGILNLGVLVRFISIPVTTGFTMAAAITIASGQINNLFGISSKSNEFLKSWINFFGHIQETRLNDALLGVCTLIVLIALRQVKNISYCRKLCKYISLARNALAVLVGILLCYFLKSELGTPFRVNDQITPGLPPFKVPPFSTTNADGDVVNFGQMAQHLGASLASIPLISILESIAVAKAFSKGKVVDATQEMVALGLCNIGSSFFGSMPITGSFTRTAINNSSGVKTPLGGAVTGALVLMTLAFLTSTFSYIPKATLSAIIIAAMVFMIEYDRIAEIWRSKKRDFFPFVITVVTCLFWSLEYGMVCGILFNMLFILYKSMIPDITLSKEKINDTEAFLIELRGNIDYAAAEELKTLVVSHVSAELPNIKLVIIMGSEINSIDSTVALNLCSLREDLETLQCKLICWNWSVKAAGVVCRLHKEVRTMFRFSKDLKQLMEDEIQINTVSNGNITTLAIS